MPKTTTKTSKKTDSKLPTNKQVAKNKQEIAVTQVSLAGVKSDTKLPKEISQFKVEPSLITQMARVYQINLRQGTQSTKTRGEVIGSTRKIYRQKGTGKARHGSVKAPIFVGGGITFGPKPREFNAKLSTKMRHRVLNGLLSQKILDGKMVVLEGLKDATGKTKELVHVFKKLDLVGKKLLLIIDKDHEKIRQAAKNISYLELRLVSLVSPFDVLKHEYLLIADSSVSILTTRMLQLVDTKKLSNSKNI